MPAKNYPERIVDSGIWEPGARWELVISDHELDPRLCTAVACVAITSIERQEVALTRYPYDDNAARANKWEIPAGHIDPRNPLDPQSPRETPHQTARREAREETGFVVAHLNPFGFRRIYNDQPSRYPEVSYIPYYWATTTKPLVEPTDPNQPVERAFPIETVRDFAESGDMNPEELVIVEHGLAAALRVLRGVD